MFHIIVTLAAIMFPIDDIIMLTDCQLAEYLPSLSPKIIGQSTIKYALIKLVRTNNHDFVDMHTHRSSTYCEKNYCVALWTKQT